MRALIGFLKNFKYIFRKNKIHYTLKYGRNLKIGRFCVILDDVIVGDNVEIENFVLLKSGTRIGDNVYVDSYVRSSGSNKIGNNVTLRFGSTIARNVNIGNDTFISPNVMTIYTTHKGEKSKGTYIGDNVFIGTNAVIGPDIKIGNKVVIGSMSYVTNNCLKPGLYRGIPAVKVSNHK
jgi:UDP-2-acetamido-3-amino-2,3-dideoxy-glucuronate N-acetyltransferase